MSIYREYDIRGVVGRDLTEEVAARIGAALGTMIAREDGKAAAVGRDIRSSSVSLAGAIARGLEAAGIEPVDIGVCPTPLLYFATFELPVQGGVAVTGSHNPPEYNGFKLCVGRDTLYGAGIQEVRRLAEAAEVPAGGGPSRVRREEIIPRYLDHLTRQFKDCGRSGDRPLKVVVDSGNGTAGLVAPQLFRAMGCEVIELYSEPDGRFPHHHPDPTVPANLEDLIRTVRELRADLGVAFDGDADRLGVVDERGEIIWGDRILILYSRSVLKERPGATIISEVKASQQLYDDIERHGGKALMWKTGHSLIKSKMRETGAALAGEMSGHMFFADRYHGYDDGIYAACRLIEILSRSGRPLSSLLADLPPLHATPEIRVDCRDEVKFKVVERVRERLGGRWPLIDIDGVRVRFPDGWGLVRASNTQPALVLRFEAPSPERLSEIRRMIETEVDRAIREVG